LIGALLVLLISAFDASNRHVVLIGGLIVPPLLVAAFGSSIVVAIVGLGSIGAGIALGSVDSLRGTTDHAWRLSFLTVAVVIAVWLSALRARRDERLRLQHEELATAGQLADSARRLRVALDASRMGTFVWRRDLGTVTWDRQMETIFGFEPGGYDGTYEGYVQRLHPDDRSFVESEVAAAVEEKRAYSFEHRVVWPDETVRWIEGRGEVITNDAGEAIGTTGVSVDITDRKEQDAFVELAAEQAARVLELPQLFEEDLTPQQIADRACRSALEIFGSDTASLWDVSGQSYVLRARAIADGVDVAVWSPGHAVDMGTPSSQEELRAMMTTAYVARDDSPESAQRLRDMGLEAAVRIALTAGGRVTSLLALGWTKDVGAPSAYSLRVADRLGDQLALALQRAEQRRAEKEAADLTARLQAGLLPVEQFTRSGLRVASLYEPGEARLLLGGDFFDLTGSADVVSFVLGDVAGHGPEAAALGTFVRWAWNGMATAGIDPVTWLPVLNEIVLRRQGPAATFVTVVTGTIDLRERRMRFAVAGHPAPLVLAADVQQTHPHPGAPLGVLKNQQWLWHHVDLPSPWAVLLYTDGLVEGLAAPGSTQRWGIAEVIDRLADLNRPYDVGSDFLHSLLSEAQKANGGPLADDVAVLLLAQDLVTDRHDRGAAP
jgi:PAS domain S-box-containing protein